MCHQLPIKNAYEPSTFLTYYSDAFALLSPSNFVAHKPAHEQRLHFKLIFMHLKRDNAEKYSENFLIWYFQPTLISLT